MSCIFDYAILAKFRSKMYETLLDEDNLIRKTPRYVEFKEDEYPPIQCFSLQKNNSLYLLNKDFLAKLPIRVIDTKTLNTKSNDVVELITTYKSFKITPQKIYNFKRLVDIDNIVHSSPFEWTLWKIVCWSGRISRIAIRFSSNPRFGKTGYLDILHYLLNKSYVIPRPKSIPGIARGISANGLLALDEMGKLSSEIKQEVQSVLFQTGSMSPYLTLGTAGSEAFKTKPKYNISNMSIFCLFNRLIDYDSRDSFFDYMFPNSIAINDRFLPLMPGEGYMDQNQFINNKTSLTEENEEIFRNIMKSAEWYYLNWEMDINQSVISETIRKFKDIEGRHMKSFRTILCFIYLYSNEDQDIYTKYTNLLHDWYNNYKKQIEPDFNPFKIEEEVV